MYAKIKWHFGGWGIQAWKAGSDNIIRLLQMYETTSLKSSGKGVDLSNFGNEWKL